MPRAKTLYGISQTFHNLDSKTKEHFEENDCVVKAVATACDISYEEAHQACADRGRTRGRGMFRADWLPIFVALGFEPLRMDPQHFISQYPGVHKGLQNVTTHHPERFNQVWEDGHTYLLITSGHVGVVKDGKNLDWTVGRAKRVKAIYKLVKHV